MDNSAVDDDEMLAESAPKSGRCRPPREEGEIHLLCYRSVEVDDVMHMITLPKRHPPDVYSVNRRWKRSMKPPDSRCMKTPHDSKHTVWVSEMTRHDPP